MSRRQGERGPTGDHGQTGEAGKVGPQGERGPRGRSFVFSRSQLVAFLIVVAAAAWGNWQAYQASKDVEKTAKSNTVLLHRQDRETTERRDVGCKGAEAQHRQEVRDLERTYLILKDPPPVYKELLANPLVRDSFKDTILAAANDQDVRGVFVSPFCDDPGIGLKEPDPVVPKVPDYVEKLLPGITKQVVRVQAGGVKLDRRN